MFSPVPSWRDILTPCSTEVAKSMATTADHTKPTDIALLSHVWARVMVHLILIFCRGDFRVVDALKNPMKKSWNLQSVILMLPSESNENVQASNQQSWRRRCCRCINPNTVKQRKEKKPNHIPSQLSTWDLFWFHVKKVRIKDLKVRGLMIWLPGIRSIWVLASLSSV